MSVTQLAAMVKAALSQTLPAKVLVRGQVSNFSDRAHWFFSLKDEGASLRCVCFASSARPVAFPVRDGLEVLATGRVDYFEAQGQLQLYVEKLEPVGVGELELRFRRLCAELKELGYFELERKRPLPTFVRRVAVVTSRTGAALQDVLDTAAKRWAGCEMLLLDVRVQGEAAAGEVAAALDALSRYGAAMGIDVVILTRGGGSIEDLWAFNERAVADAVFQCALPVVAGIGHETDTTIAELVADLRCATPTQAAMRVVPDAAALREQVESLRSALHMQLKRELKHQRERLSGLARHPLLSRPEAALQPLRQRVERLQQGLLAALPRLQRARADRLDALARQLRAVSPTAVLQRGYSITLDAAGGVVRAVAQAKPGGLLTTRVSDGQFESRVVGGAPLRRPAKDEARGPSLFSQPRDDEVDS